MVDENGNQIVVSVGAQSVVRAARRRRTIPSVAYGADVVALRHQLKSEPAVLRRESRGVEAVDCRRPAGGERRRRQIGAVDLDDCEIGLRVGRQHGRRDLVSAREPHLDLAAALDDVVVGDDETAAAVPDDSAALGSALPGLDENGDDRLIGRCP